MGTEKKENILKAAMELFASQGYHATSTSKVAKAAGVSEGLIFRHFENKEGLLNALMNVGSHKVEEMYSQIMELDEPKARLKAVLSIPFVIEESEFAFWKILYSLKWQADFYDASVTETIRAVLIDVFRSLKYSKPAAEADTILAILDGFATAILLRDLEDKEGMRKSILDKYDLE